MTRWNGATMDLDSGDKGDAERGVRGAKASEILQPRSMRH
jgi:hypothetical protein